MKKYTTVTEFLDALEPQQLEQVTLLRQIITHAHPELEEHVKWNSPSFMLNGEDRITFSVRPGFAIAIVLHFGATHPEQKDGVPAMHDSSGLIEWKSDTRGVISFVDLDDIRTKQQQFVDVLHKWLSLTV
jgi:uncharacterized protein YdhG (YjbR/CyaY superfamily)